MNKIQKELIILNDEMNIFYSFRKSFAAIIQKYRMRKHLSTVRKLFLFLFFVWIVGSLLTILTQYIFAKELHHSIRDYLQYFWVVIIELVSGFDIPDTIPLVLFSQIISVIMLIMGIIVVGLFTGQIISMVIHVLQRNEYVSEKPENFQFKNPIVICGVSPKLENVILELKKSNMCRNREIVIIGENSDEIKKVDEEKFNDVWYIKGEPSLRETLEKAIGRDDCRIIILERNEHDQYFTSQCVINTALAVEAIDESIHTVVEVTHIPDAEHFQRTKINDMINVSDFGMKLISQAALKPGMAKVFTGLLGDNAGKSENVQIFFSDLPLHRAFVGKTYKEIAKKMCQELCNIDATLLGFAKYLTDNEKTRFKLRLRNTNYFIQINPKNNKGKETHKIENGKLFFFNNTILTEKDRLIYLSDSPINFKQVLKQRKRS